MPQENAAASLSCGSRGRAAFKESLLRHRAGSGISEHPHSNRRCCDSRGAGHHRFLSLGGKSENFVNLLEMHAAQCRGVNAHAGSCQEQETERNMALVGGPAFTAVRAGAIGLDA